MIGFGDPVFDPRAAPDGDRKRSQSRGKARAYSDYWRGAGIDRNMLMQGLPQLPDTADELKAIARRRSAFPRPTSSWAGHATVTAVKRAPLGQLPHRLFRHPWAGGRRRQGRGGALAREGQRGGAAQADPGQYEYFSCGLLAERRKFWAERELEIKLLMDKAECRQGAFVNVIAYKGDHIAAQEEIKVIDETRRAKRCDGLR